MGKKVLLCAFLVFFKGIVESQLKVGVYSGGVVCVRHGGGREV